MKTPRVEHERTLSLNSTSSFLLYNKDKNMFLLLKMFLFQRLCVEMWAFHLRLVLTGTICSVYVLNLLAVAQCCSAVFTLVTQLSRTRNLVASLLKVKHLWEMMLSKGGVQICIELYFKIDCSGISFHQVQKLISPLGTAFSCGKIPEQPYSQGPGASLP